MTTANKVAPPAEGVLREATFERAATEADPGDGLTFEGYGAVFNSPTRIDSWEGFFDEQIAPGAFKKSVREKTPKFQFDHGRHQMIGSIPIGKITEIREDETGLYVKARLSDNWLVEPIRDAIAEGSVDGMSFRMNIVREEWRDIAGKIVKPEDVPMLLWSESERGPLLRTIKEIKVSEVGPVVWPAYEDTKASVRSKGVIDLGRLDEPEQRKLLARAVFELDAADNSGDESERSDEEPQDTTDDVAVEHSDEDDDTPQVTEAADADPADEHESNLTDTAPKDAVDAARDAAFEQTFTDALNQVKNMREATPPITRR